METSINSISRWRSVNITLKISMWKGIYWSLENTICHDWPNYWGRGYIKVNIGHQWHRSSGKVKILGFMKIETEWYLWVQDGSSWLLEQWEFVILLLVLHPLLCSWLLCFLVLFPLPDVFLSYHFISSLYLYLENCPSWVWGSPREKPETYFPILPCSKGMSMWHSSANQVLPHKIDLNVREALGRI